jgi:hypothetical protein
LCFHTRLNTSLSRKRSMAPRRHKLMKDEKMAASAPPKRSG